jgi:adenine-specific DNA-methyltransferase
LDFFAGSGTTGHAVLELNRADGGKRKFILCTNNEGQICSEVCYPRIERVIKGYSFKGKKRAGLGGNLKYFKTGFVNADPTDKNKRVLVDKSTEMLCLKEDCFDEVTKGQSFRVFSNVQNKHLGIIYDDDGIEPLKKEVLKLNQKFVVYVFSLDDSAREEEFEDVNKLVELKPIPAVILNVYKRIFK